MSGEPRHERGGVRSVVLVAAHLAAPKSVLTFHAFATALGFSWLGGLAVTRPGSHRWMW